MFKNIFFNYFEYIDYNKLNEIRELKPFIQEKKNHIFFLLLDRNKI